MEKQIPRKREKTSCLLIAILLACAFCLYVGWFNFAVVFPEEAMIQKASEGNTRRVSEFLEQGVDVNARFDGMQTALWDAAKQNDVVMIKLLLDAGANPFLDFQDLTPLEVATNPECKQLLLKAEDAWRKRKQ